MTIRTHYEHIKKLVCSPKYMAVVVIKSLLVMLKSIFSFPNSSQFSEKELFIP